MRGVTQLSLGNHPGVTEAVILQRTSLPPTVVTLRTLGALDLRSTSRQDTSGLMARPKPLALLAYLGVAHRAGYGRRDTVLAMLWPELDHARGRHALSQTLHMLRRAIGDDVVVARGREELGINPGSLWCDASALMEAQERGDHEAVVALYRGDFLDGLHVGDAAGFERWVETQRATLRRTAALAARALADQRTKEGRVDDALHFADRAARLDPLDEAAARSLMMALARMGDRSGSIIAYNSFEQRLRDELEIAPSRETRALMESIRESESPPAS